MGSQAELARTLGVSCGTVNQWVKGSRPIPANRAVAIERATGGLVTRQEMFPDTWQDVWPELAKPRKRKAEAQGA